jgi:hypothetical protein
VIFNNQVAPGRNAAIRAGWNDAAWGRPHRAGKRRPGRPPRGCLIHLCETTNGPMK